MDVPEDELIARYERFLQVIMKMAVEGDPNAGKLVGMGSITRLKREAIINAALQPNDALARKIAPSYPGIDVVAFVRRLRVRAVIERLS